MLTSVMPAILLLIPLAVIVSAQYHIESWTTDNGLPQNSVLAILQTRDGYLWLATNDGLARYDGDHFTVFDSSNTPDLCCNRFTSLYEDRSGALWIGTDENKLVRYQNHRFSTLITDPKDPVAGAVSITADRTGNLVVVGYNGLFRLLDGKFAVERRSKSYYFLAKSGTEWRWDEGRLIRIEGGRQTGYRLPGQPKVVEAIYEDRQGTLWIGTEKGLSRLKDGRLDPFALQGGPTEVKGWAFCEDPDGYLWIGTDNGLFKYRAGKANQIAFNQGLSVSSVRSLFTDREGVVWVGTYDQGLIKANETIVTSFTEKDGLASDNVYPVYEDSRGRIWIGSWPHGITIYENGRFRRLETPRGTLISNPLAFCEDREGRLWISGSRLWWYRDGRLVDFTSRIPPQATGIHAILQDKSGAIWFGSDRGLVRYADEKMTLYTRNEGLADDEIRALLQDREGAIWIGARNGLSRLLNDRVTTYTKANGLRSNYVRALHEDEEGTIWVGSFDGGLTRIRGGKITTYTTKEGLFCKGVFNILDDKRGNFWMTCNSGIFSVSKLQLKEYAEGRLNSINSVQYGIKDGMVNSECNGGVQPAGIKSKDGRLWIPTAGGVAVVDLSKIPASPAPPPLTIDHIEINDRWLQYEERILLGPSDENLEVHYDCLSFSKPETIKFRYMMEGLDHGWIDAGKRRVANYPYLPPGEYKFRLAALGGNGEWNELDKKLIISIPTPVYLTWWFTTLAVTCIVAVLAMVGYLTHRRRVSKLVKESERHLAFSRRLIESQENERRKVARELHDDVVNDLASLALSVHNASGKLPEGSGNLKSGMTDIHDRVVTLSEKVRNISHSLHPASLQHLGLLPAIRSICSEFRVKANLAIELFLDESIVSVSPEADISLLRIVQEALRNVEKHAQAKNVLVSLRRFDDRVELLVGDDGVGFNPSTPSSRTGLGLESMRERLKTLGGDLSITSAVGHGVEIVASLPMVASS